MIPILIGSLRTISKELIKGLEDLEIGDNPDNGIMKIVQTTERPWRLEETRCNSNSSEKPSANSSMKHSQKVKIIIK